MGAQQRSFDKGIVISFVILMAIGFVMIFSTSSVVGFTNYNDSYYFLKKHSLYVLVGAVGFFTGLFFPHQRFKMIALPGLLLSVGLLIATFIPPLGLKLGGAHRWLNLGLVSIQPVEIAKFFIVVFVATALSNKAKSLNKIVAGILPILLVIFIPVGIISQQPDLGNVILILGVTLSLLFLSPVPLSQLAGLAALGATTIIGNIAAHPYQLERIKGFLEPWADPLGRNYHIIQSFIAIGSGGLFGLGLGQSKLKFYYLPLQYSDFIFSIVCEEGGFVLALTVIACFVVLFYRGLRIAVRSGNEFSFYLAVGLTFLMVFQGIMNIGVVIGVLPVTGIPLTFISFGGTSLVMSMFFIGVWEHQKTSYPTFVGSPLLTKVFTIWSWKKNS